jgi:hypothetical protein
MLQGFLMVIVALALSNALVGKQGPQRTSSPGVTGVWQMTILGDHGVAAGLDLKQDGNRVTGTFVMPRGHGGRVPLKGDLVDGVLSLASVPDPDADAVELSIEGTFKDDGTIEGTLKSRMGERKFNAERLGGGAAMAFRPIAVQANTPSVSGKWRMSIVFNDGPRAAGLELKQEGRKVTGRLVASFAGGEAAIEGEFIDRKLTFSGATSGGPHPGLQLEFSATLKEDDSLAGTFSSPIGDFPWTAERLHQ